MKKMLFFFCTLVFAAAVHSQECVNSIEESTPVERFIIDGDEVIDTRTQLIWKRCSLGQSGDNCENGTANTYTWQQALQAAYTDPASGDPEWRLPNLKELLSIREQRCIDPAANAVLFPNTPSEWYWTASPSARNGTDAWAVHFNFGESRYRPKNTTSLHIRLVRNVYFQ